MNNWFKSFRKNKIQSDGNGKRNIPEGVWTKCTHCDAILYREALSKTLWVCPKCSCHMQLSARERLRLFLDDDSGVEIAGHIRPVDRLKFKDQKKYSERLKIAQKETGETDALVAMNGRLMGRPIVAAAFDFRFMGGSMGTVVGERFVRAVTMAMTNDTPFVCFSTSGGARMQEALFSLMQMARTSAALAKLAEAGIPYISVLTNPTMGGVSASLAMLGDVNIAEPNALIGFAGPRVIEQTVRQKLPEGFQRSEFLLSHGTADMIVDRRKMRERVSEILGILTHQIPATTNKVAE